MAFPEPVPGLVIRYGFLWSNEARRGQEEGAKDRPCAVVLNRKLANGETVVTVLPVTHATPRDPELAVAIPRSTKQRLGLDDEPAWIIVSELNRFVWPGSDLRVRTRGDAASVAYGELPAVLFREVLRKLEAALVARLTRTTTRSG